MHRTGHMKGGRRFGSRGGRDGVRRPVSSMRGHRPDVSLPPRSPPRGPDRDARAGPGYGPPIHARGRRAGTGFTLIELAVVVAIVGLLLGALLVPLATQVQATRFKDTRLRLQEIREALIGYAIVNGALPCPDTDRDGRADAVSCAAPGDTVEGGLPWLDLGVPPTDAWGRLFRYRVTGVFTVPAVPGAACAADDSQLGLCDRGDITVVTRGDDPGTPGTELKAEVDLTTTAPAIVLSFGPNGYGASDLDGGGIAAPPNVGADESNNLDAGLETNDDERRFVTRSYLQAESSDCDDADEDKPFCPFDDVVIWLSTPVLLERLVATGHLP